MKEQADVLVAGFDSEDAELNNKTIYRWSETDHRGYKIQPPEVVFEQFGLPMQGIQAISTITTMYAKEGREHEILEAVSRAIKNAK